MDLISLLIVLAILAIAWVIVTRLPLPPTVKLVAEIVLSVIALIWLISMLTGGGVHLGLGLRPRC